MPKHWYDDQAALDALSESLVDLIAMFPKRMVRVDELVHTFRMPLSHIQILALVSHRDLSIGELSGMLGVAKPNITPLVDALNSRGLVERVRSDRDRRIVQVHILPAGAECLEEVRKVVKRQICDWPASFSRNEARNLGRSLDTLIDTMNRMDGIS